jgi:tetratricopeptide (TPR) repeat protein
MSSRVPQSKLYGYWRTHPFSDQRMRAAEVRAEELKIQDKGPSEDFRALTQKIILDFEPAKDKNGELSRHLERAALTAWPKGGRAEEIRLSRLHRQRDAELEKGQLQRDYGKLVRAYHQQIDEVAILSPESTFHKSLEKEMIDLRAEAMGLLPKARDIWQGEIYQIPFLETFLSNFPTAKEVPAIALKLGEAYSRLGRQSDAVAQFLRASEAGPKTAAGKRAIAGLRNLTPYLEELAALKHLSDQIDDGEIRHSASTRLDQQAGTFKDIANGAEYVRLYPEGKHVPRVRERIELLAQNLYGEVILYQSVGDTVKSLERIQAIMTHAPFSNAAEKLRAKAVLDS